MEILYAQIELGGHLQGFSRNESDDLARSHFDTIPGRLRLYRFKYAMHRSYLEIGEIHCHLRLISRGQRNAHCLDAREPSGRRSDRPRDAPGNAHIAGRQIDVVGDQNLSRTDGGCPGGWVQRFVPDIRNPVTQSFKLAPADVFQIHAVRMARRSLVEIDRELQLPPQALAKT